MFYFVKDTPRIYVNLNYIKSKIMVINVYVICFQTIVSIDDKYKL